MPRLVDNFCRPKILLLHLKRFIVEEKMVYATEEREGEENQPPNSPAKPISVEYIFKKNKAKVHLPFSLTLEPFQASQARAETAPPIATLNKDYSLKSVVHHVGSRASSGHYVAHALRQDEDEVSASPLVKDGVELPAKVPSEKRLKDAWYFFDDKRSARGSPDFATKPLYKETAYMLLYSLEENSEEESKLTPAAEEAKAASLVETFSLQENVRANEDLSSK